MVKITYKTVIKGDAALGLSPDTTHEIWWLSTEYCCVEAKEAFEELFMRFGDWDGVPICPEVNIFRCHPYPEGAVFDQMPIRYCPFCGKEIVLIEGERAKLEKYEITILPEEIVCFLDHEPCIPDEEGFSRCGDEVATCLWLERLPRRELP
jgi:hypothetical protein